MAGLGRFWGRFFPHHHTSADKSEPPGKRRRRSPTRLNQETPAPRFSTNRITSFDLLSRSQRTSGSPRTRSFRRRFFPDVPDSQWNDWRWQSQHRIRTLEQMERMLGLSDEERHAMQMGGTMLPVGITPYYMSLLDPDDPQQPLRRTVVPTTGEFAARRARPTIRWEKTATVPLPGLVHRYPDRVLLLAIDFCSTYCRYCTRSRVVGHGEIAPNEKRLEAIFDYLRRTPTSATCSFPAAIRWR